MRILLLCALLIAEYAICTKIRDYQPIANQIIDYLISGQGRGQALGRLTTLTDTFGHRMVGEKSLDKAIDYLIEKMKSEGLNNVHKEIVHNLPYWVRGTDDRASLVSPRRQKLAILALGGTVRTPPSGICARAIVVRNFADLERKKDQVKGRIVIYNQDWQGYGRSSAYRTKGASKAAAFGAVAVLIRSVTPHSVYSLHTGQQFYEPQVPKIPAASITVEDAQMLYRMQMRGQTIKICINMSSETIGTVDSYNTVAEITGSVYPNEIVMISGHLDSWDVGNGAMDDGGGVITAWQALSVIKALGLKPKRTVRAVFWTAEEQGYLGNTAYYQNHKSGGPNKEIYRFVYESDAGAFKPDGLSFTGPRGTPRWTKMSSVLQLLAPINATKLYWLSDNEPAGDVEPWRRNDGVPAAMLITPAWDKYYFTYHHTEGDRIDVFRPGDLDYVSALNAVVAYVIADMDEPL